MLPYVPAGRRRPQDAAGKALIWEGCREKFPRKREEILWDQNILERLFHRKTLKHLKKFPNGSFPPNVKTPNCIYSVRKLMSVHCEVWTHVVMPIPKTTSSYSRRLPSPRAHLPLHLSTPALGSLFPPPWEQMPKRAQSTNTQRTNAVLKLGHCNHKSLQKASENSYFPELELRGL